MNESEEKQTNEWNVTEDGVGVDTGSGVFYSLWALGIVQFYNSTRAKEVNERKPD